MGSHQEVHSLESIPNLLDAEEFRRQGHLVIDFLAEYYQNIEKYPVISQVQPGYLAKFLPNSAPSNPESIETILQDVQSYVIPGLSHWQHPSFFAYFPANASLARLLGEILCTGFSVVGFNWFSSPAATELEKHVMDWLGQMLELPRSFFFSGNGGGVIHVSTIEAMICTLTAARDRMLRTMAPEVADDDIISKLVVYGSDQTHCSFQKAAQIVGINPRNIRAIKTTKATQFGMSPESLKKTIEEDLTEVLVPFYVCATVGTTSSTAVDPLKPICDIANEYSIWIHVDAAYAGAASICPEFRHFFHGIEGASSFSFNAHKWLPTTLECCCLWIKDPTALTMSLGQSPDYLKNKATDSKQVVDYKDWQLSHSRRFRALKLWTVLRSYGVTNLKKHIRHHVRLAKTFEEYVKKDDRLEIVCPRNFSTVCFRISPSAVARMELTNGGITDQIGVGQDDHIRKQNLVNEINSKLLQCVNDSGQVSMTHAVVDGIYTIRLAVGSTFVEDRHVFKAWKVVQDHADKLLTGKLF